MKCPKCNHNVIHECVEALQTYEFSVKGGEPVGGDLVDTHYIEDSTYQCVSCFHTEDNYYIFLEESEK